MSITIICGTRPELIKMLPVFTELKEYKHIWTGQHFSPNMSDIFFKELNIRYDYKLDIGSNNEHGAQTGKMMMQIEELINEIKPNLVIVHGDTNSALAGAMVAAKKRIPLAHIEAGLRSYEKSMAEEQNRVVIDHLSDFHFAPSERAKLNLIRESINEKNIFVVGNTIIDVLKKYGGWLKTPNQNLQFPGNQNYGLLTLHRPENVDDRVRLKRILLAVARIKLPFVFPAHPRFKKKIKEFGYLLPDNIKLIEPLGFLDFLKIEANCIGVITDSGGVQEEAMYLHKPCVTIRDSTERPETIDIGANRLVTPTRLKVGFNEAYKGDWTWTNKIYGVGESGKQIVGILRKKGFCNGR